MNSLLKNIYLAEDDEDMFPGITAGMFRKSIAPPDIENTTLEKVAKQLKKAEILSKVAEKQRRNIRGSMFNQLGNQIGYSYQMPTHWKYIDVQFQQEMQGKFEFSLNELNNFKVDPSLTWQEIEPFLLSIEEWARREKKTDEKIVILKRRYQTAKRAAALKNVNADASSVPKKNIPESSIPHSYAIFWHHGNKLSGTQRTYRVPNPYFEAVGSDKQFVGHPAHAPWAGKVRTLYLALKDVMKENNIPEFDTIYGIQRKYNANSRPDLYFIMHNQDNSMVMYRGTGDNRPIVMVNQKFRLTAYNSDRIIQYVKHIIDHGTPT